MRYLISNINDYKEKDLISHKSNKIDKIKRQQSKIGKLQLSKLLEIDNIEIETNINGKPYLKNSNIYFNISHSNDYVITVINNTDIGIDIEKIKEVDLNDIKVFCTKKEQEYILSKQDEIYKKLFQIYTLKEAYIKCIGGNINNLNDIEFEIINNKVISNINNIEFGFINEIDNYIISYAVKKEN